MFELLFVLVPIGLFLVLPIIVLVLVLKHRIAIQRLDDRLRTVGEVLGTLDDRLSSLERVVASRQTGGTVATPRTAPGPATSATAAPPVAPPPPATEPAPAVPVAPEAKVAPPPRPPSPPGTATGARPAGPAGAGGPVAGHAPPPTAAGGPGTTATGGFGFERALGTRVAVWLGALSLALAGAFLVKYSIDRGWLGPATRVTLAFVFGAALLGAGEWMAARARGVAQGLAAAGIAVLFAALLAGVRLYGLIPLTVGFAGMLLTTATAVLLSMRHGQLVAILGLLGGFVTPLWVGGGEPRPWMLMIYLLLIQSGLLLVSRRMRWWPVAGLTLLGGMGWAALWISDLPGLGGATLPIGLFLLISALSFVLVTGPAAAGASWREPGVPALLAWGGAGIAVLLLAALTHTAGHGPVEWMLFAALGAGCLVLGRLEPRNEGLAWLAALAGAAMLSAWAVALEPAQHTRFAVTAASVGALYAIGAYLAVWGSVRPDRWAALSGASAIVYFLAAWGGLQNTEPLLPWGAIGLLLAISLTAMAWPIARRRETLARGDHALAASAVAITSLVSLAVPLELERAWIGVAWALEVAALAWLAGRLRVRALETLAWALGGMVVIRLLVNPAVLEYPIGEGVPFNWLLYGYGVPIVAFVAAARLFRRQQRGLLADALETAAAALGLAMLTLQVRQYFHPGDLAGGGFPLAEWGAYTVVWSLYGLALFRWQWASGRRLHLAIAASPIGLALAQGIIAQGWLANPLLRSLPVGETPLFNALLFVYALPALLALAAAREFRRAGLIVAVRACGSVALVFAFLTVTLEVRQVFHGTLLTEGPTTNAEMYTYSLAWVLFATALLVAGIVTRGVVLRYGSAVVMLAAVGKVFLVDTANLEDLYRVLSFFGLGVSLMLLAFLYQRFVFGARPR